MATTESHTGECSPTCKIICEAICEAESVLRDYEMFAGGLSSLGLSSTSGKIERGLRKLQGLSDKRQTTINVSRSAGQASNLKRLCAEYRRQRGQYE